MMKRREFIKTSGQLTIAATMLNNLNACGSDSHDLDNLNYQGESVFLHGIASGDPLHDRVILWTRVTNDGSIATAAIPVSYTVAIDPYLKNIVAKGKALATSESDFTVKVDPKLPYSNTTYYYKFEALGYTSPIGRTRTLPHSDLAAHEVNRVRLAVVSCANYGFGYFNAYADIAKQTDISAVIHLGDYIYEYAEGVFRDKTLIKERPIEPKHEIVSLEDYRHRYACYRTDIDLQACHRQHPFIVVWDDHEIANNAWKDGAGNHQSEKEGSYIKRKMAAVQAYHEWMPIRDDSSNALDSQLRIYRRFEFGKLFDLNMLDTRIFGRQKQNISATNEPKRQLLGIEQEEWLYQNLLTSKKRGAHWQVLGQQVILSPFKRKSEKFSSDLWDGYASARNRLLDFIKNNNIDNTVILTGDIHASLAFDVCKDPFDNNQYNSKTGKGSLAVEFVCPALTSLRTSKLAGKDLNPHQKFNNYSDRGYMLLDITEQAFQCEWYYTDTLKTRDDSTQFAKALLTRTQTNRLVEGEQSHFISNSAVLAAADRAVAVKIQQR